MGSTRRDFLKMMGFSLAAASLASCETPVNHAIPYLIKPVDVDPGISNYYASTFIKGGDYCSILVKTRDGRPIKIEGNTTSKVTKGGTTAQVEASILSLYDKERLTSPYLNGQPSDWDSLDKEILSQLSTISQQGGAIRLVTHTVLSPSTRSILNDFISKFPGTALVVYDPISLHGMVYANQLSFGKALIPAYHFEKAEVIVGIGADFLTNWINPAGIIRDYAASRKVSSDKPSMSRHFQFETTMTTTGANADYRTPIRPSQEGLVATTLYNRIAAKSGATKINIADLDNIPFLQKAADNLWVARGKSLVVAGSNDPDVQLVINGINQLLGNYGNTLDITMPVNYRQGDEIGMTSFVDELKSGKVKAVIFYNANPVYNHPLGAEIASALKNVPFTVSTADRMDETTSLVKAIAPDHHFLESWNDAEPEAGQLSLSQPGITPLFDTRQAQESFMKWSGNLKPSFYDYLKTQWKEKYFITQKAITDFQNFWDKCLFDGVFEYPVTPAKSQPAPSIDLVSLANRINRNYRKDNAATEIVFYSKPSIGDGTFANIPWLQEMPDPVSRACWENYLSIPISLAKENGVVMYEGHTRYATLTVGNQSFKIPVIIQPGQAKGTVALAIGYGRMKAGKVGNGIGVNVYPLMPWRENHWSWAISDNVKVEILDDKTKVPQIQTHNTDMDRVNIIQEDYLVNYRKPGWERSYQPEIHASEYLDKKLNDGKVNGEVRPSKVTLWKGHDYPDHHWGMMVDLNSCVGCGTCTIACQVENNVAVVGPSEVLNRREMLWIRIDRYYSSDASPDDVKGLENPADNPEVVFQPMMCQQCNNAPCETVCPVAATSHSSEGINQMVYNRCIGTRYCANNCPYKVRRFNWFKYFENSQFDKNLAMNNDLGRMVLNPDVTVRSRGVMEKCTFCIQRIQAGKLAAKRERRRTNDKDVNTACAAACPAGALVFGDLNDPESRLSRMLAIKEDNGSVMVTEKRAYNVLEEVNTRPNVWYFAKIRNKDLEDIKA